MLKIGTSQDTFSSMEVTEENLNAAHPNHFIP